MPLSTNNILKSAIAAAIFLSVAAPTALSAQPDPLSGAYVAGAYASYSLREGYRKYDGIDKYRHIDDTNPFIFGGVLGKRFALGIPWLRLQATAEGAWGTVKDGDFYVVEPTNGDNILASLYSVYTTGGLAAEAHLLFPADGYTYFISAGLGEHAILSSSTLKTASGGKEIDWWDGGKTWALSPSVNIGLGVDRVVNDRRASSLSYNFRFWQSMQGRMVDELFPMGVDYSEFLFTHMIQLQVVLPAAGGRFRQ
ncbi:MAG: hypothetical protein LBH93_07725 [Chitinispirillales bacterium]|jgi:hypothetical protein|nr:hypothetical protein [Chitinispirillales bacterium]